MAVPDRHYIQAKQFEKGPAMIRGYALFAENGRLRVELMRPDGSIHHVFYVEGERPTSGLVLPDAPGAIDLTP